MARVVPVVQNDAVSSVSSTGAFSIFPYYRFIRNRISPAGHTTLGPHLWNLLLISAYFTVCFRCLATALTLKYPAVSLWYYFSIYYQGLIIFPPEMLTPDSWLFCGIVFLSGIFFLYQVHMIHCPTVFALYQDLVSLRTSFFTINPQLIYRPIKPWYRLDKYAKEFKRFLMKLIDLKGILTHFTPNFPMKTIPTATPSTCRAFLAGFLLIDLIELFLTVLSIIVYFFVLILVYQPLMSHYADSPLFILYFLAELSGIYYISLVGLRHGVFTSYLLLNLAVLYRHHCRYLNGNLRRLLVFTDSPFYQAYLATKLAQFKREQNRLLVIMETLNSQFYSKPYLGYALTNLPLNLLLITNLTLYWHLQPTQSFLIVAFILTQMLGAIFAIIPMNLSSKAAYSSGAVFYRLMARLRLLGPKVKCTTFYEQLHTEKRVIFSYFAILDITSKQVFEFVLMYGSFLMITIQFMAKITFK